MASAGIPATAEMKMSANMIENDIMVNDHIIMMYMLIDFVVSYLQE